MEIREFFKDRECYEGENGILCLGDARDLIKRVPDGYVDHVITDPPWGVGQDEYDDGNLIYEIEDEMWRVLKGSAWMVFFSTPKYILRVREFRKFEYVWMIPYLFWSFGSVSRNPLGSQSSYSVVVVMRKGKPKVVHRRKDVIVSDELPVVKGNVKEPQFKPTYAVATLLTMFTREGDVVLDPFAGYGSIPLVCEVFGRKWIGFEIDPLKFRIAKQILKEKRVSDISRMKRELATL